jgi:hypothetical protein
LQSQGWDEHAIAGEVFQLENSKFSFFCAYTVPVIAIKALRTQDELATLIVYANPGLNFTSFQLKAVTSEVRLARRSLPRSVLTFRKVGQLWTHFLRAITQF